MKTPKFSRRILPGLLLATLALALPSQAKPENPDCKACKFAAEEEIENMPYSTRADIEVMLAPRLLKELTDDLRDGVADEQKLEAIIASVDSVIDGYLRGLYTVPLTVVPVEVMGVSRDHTIFELYRRRGEVPEQWKDAKKDADARLRDIKKGTLVLKVTSPDVQQSVPILVDKTESDEVFPKGLLDRF